MIYDSIAKTEGEIYGRGWLEEGEEGGRGTSCNSSGENE